MYPNKKSVLHIEEGEKRERERIGFPFKVTTFSIYLIHHLPFFSPTTHSIILNNNHVKVTQNGIN